MPTPVRFNQSYNGYDPRTIFYEDPAQKQLRPIASADAYTGAGFQFGQEKLGDPGAYSGFSVGTPITRSDELARIREELNSFQQNTFNEQQSPAKRASSSLTESITKEQDSLNSYLEEFNKLRTKLGSITAPNYTDEYSRLRTAQGIPQLESDFLGIRQKRRQLPYTERAATGNAGLATEAQLQANIGQKDIPLNIDEANLIDRLKLASDFVTNSLNLKEKDFNASRLGITDAINLVGETINLSKSQLSDYYARQKDLQAREQAAQKFALENAIQTPYYQIGNTIYDTATQAPKFINNNGTIGTIDGSKLYSKPEEFFKDSGINSFDQIAPINSTTIADKNAVLDLRQKYPDAGISATDSFGVASGKLQNSRIYRDQVRGPVGSGGGGGGGGVLGLTNQQIDNISPLVTQFQNSPIVQNYNTIGEGYSFVKSLSNNTTNPADDQALIYSLAKALDPGSVVREGEYATVQKYAQSMVQSYGKSVDQALTGKGFLSDTARKNIKATIESRFKSAETSYKNLYAETERRVNLIGNTNKGSQLLNNYGGAFAPTNSQSSFIGPVNPSPPTAAAQPKQTQSFFNKTINWLFGK